MVPKRRRIKRRRIPGFHESIFEMMKNGDSAFVLGAHMGMSFENALEALVQSRTGGIGGSRVPIGTPRVPPAPTKSAPLPALPAPPSLPALPKPTPVPPRLARDINVDPAEPRRLSVMRRISRSPAQTAQLRADMIAAARAGGHSFRVDQQQVNAQGQRVGLNRPDLQYTDANGVRQYIEYDTPSSTRGQAHYDRIRANDPNG